MDFRSNRLNCIKGGRIICIILMLCSKHEHSLASKQGKCYQINHLYNKTLQDIHIYVAYSRPNSWTDCAGYFCGHWWVDGDVIDLKKSLFSTDNAGPFIIKLKPLYFNSLIIFIENSNKFHYCRFKIKFSFNY